VKEELASEADGHDEEGQQASIFGDGDAIKDEANEDEGGDFMGEEEADGADQLIGEGEFENQIGGGASV